MIPVTELRAGAVFLDNGEPFRVLKYTHKKLGRGKANIRLKVKNLKTGVTLEKVFNSGAKVEEADMSNLVVQFSYQDKSKLHFEALENGQKISLLKADHQDAGNFLARGVEVKLSLLDDQPLGLEIPATVELKVKKTEPGIKGNSATNIYKPATLESGYKLQVPLFINEGDVIKVNTESGRYVGRV